MSNAEKNVDLYRSVFCKNHSCSRARQSRSYAIHDNLFAVLRWKGSKASAFGRFDINIRTFQISLPALGRSKLIKSTAVASGRTFSRGYPDSTDIRKATKSFYQYRCKSLSRISLVRTVLWIYLLAQFLYLVPSARE